MKIETPFPAVALCGPKGAGKSWIITEVLKNVDSALEIMNKETKKQIQVMCFADPIYMAQAILFGNAEATTVQRARQFNEIIKEQGIDNHIEPTIGMSPRMFRQQFGTEFMRNAGTEDVWLKMLGQKLNRHIVDGSHSGFIIADVRFPNELKFAKQEGFLNFYINTMGVDVGDHPSEKHTIKLAKKCDDQITNKEQADEIVDIISDMFINYISNDIEIIT